ncbi:serine/threonine protein kinase family protein [Babesia bovis T2Bo]|uniref:Serine/threonine protein kinase, putative n=1 Tax=Babesia bovis TaxID=5865 RepID=A7ARG8_BABBO|nr:serine/threonine protein kinase family protein [Babesia bovis T2Bo]EDO07137.1 serine/threonine protein kinase family protein [Babesia bovis T2Bo]|eukprot:XP_001610705.1 serine/threonine protein kinase [Babesia bovis T2Bo]
MEEENTSKLAIGDYGMSAWTPKKDDVQSNSVVVHGGSRLQHGINSVDTVSTYRSDVCDDNARDNYERAISVLDSASAVNDTRTGHIGRKAYPLKDSTANGLRWEYTKLSPVNGLRCEFSPQNGAPIVNKSLFSKQNAKMVINHFETPDGCNLVPEKCEELPAAALCYRDESSRYVNNYPCSARGRGQLKPLIYPNNAIATSYRQSCGKVFKKNRHDKDIMMPSNAEGPVGILDTFRRKEPCIATSPTTIVGKRASGYFWHRPFAVKRRDKVLFFRGLPYVETVNPDVQKSWHLEAISALTREQYASLKMTMLRLSKSVTNIDPKLLMMLSKGSWEVLQEGTFGTVYIGYIDGLGYSAVKIPVSFMVQNDPVGVMRRYVNEWDILSRCDHPNIVKLCGGLIFGVFDIWLCTELISGADLHSIKYDPKSKRVITPQASLKICRQLADVVNYLHTPTVERGKIVHRDIKPENIIVMPNWDIKLCDFGDAWEDVGQRVDNISGATWLYAPPELLTHKSIVVDIVGVGGGADVDLTEVSEKWDIWSMGCVFQEMFGYAGPFHHLVDVNDGPTEICEKMVHNAINGLVPEIPHALASTKMGQLIAQCLQNDPSLRPTAAQVCAVLQAPDLVLLH